MIGTSNGLLLLFDFFQEIRQVRCVLFMIKESITYQINITLLYTAYQINITLLYTATQYVCWYPILCHVDWTGLAHYTAKIFLYHYILSITSLPSHTRT